MVNTATDQNGDKSKRRQNGLVKRRQSQTATSQNGDT